MQWMGGDAVEGKPQIAAVSSLSPLPTVATRRSPPPDTSGGGQLALGGPDQGQDSLVSQILSDPR
jgi:hypothetical protein